MEKSSTFLPSPVATASISHPPKLRNGLRQFLWTFGALVITAFIYTRNVDLGFEWYSGLKSQGIASFYSKISLHQDLCTGVDGRGSSHSGYIGLKGDSEKSMKRSFFWLFEAQQDAENAPVILTIGGGPGTSGMINPLFGQSHCIIQSNGTVLPNPNAWSERFNLLALDHPIGVGFSYGPIPNNSRTAAFDVYDFLQKFFVLYPHLLKNKLVVASGSYGGTYVPHIATVIHEQNRAIAMGKGQPGAQHINLESMMVSNPYSDTLSHYRWMLHQRCYNTDLHNSTTCTELFSYLPECLEKIQFAFQHFSLENRLAALDVCRRLDSNETHGNMIENVNKKCDGSVEDCFPGITWIANFLNSSSTREALGIPHGISYNPINNEVFHEFDAAGDLAQPAHLLYEPLVNDGIRLLHYVGKLDANCGWPGIISFLKFLQTPFQKAFIDAPDVPWPTEDVATVRAIGEGAGNFTWILMGGAGHFVTHDQPVLVKSIVEHWVENRPFFSS